MAENMLDPKSTISDYGKFADPNIPVVQGNVFVNTEYGMVNESVLRTITRQIMKEELSILLMDMGAFQEKDGHLYYGNKKLVYASDIFFN